MRFVIPYLPRDWLAFFLYISRYILITGRYCLRYLPKRAKATAYLLQLTVEQHIFTRDIVTSIYE